MKKFFRWLITIILLLSLSFIIWKFVLSREKPVYENPISPVKVALPYRSSVEEFIELSSYVEAEDMVAVVPFVSGTIVEYYAKVGSYVEENEVIAQIDNKSFLLQLQQAQAMYLAAEATFKRVSSLYEAKAATEQSYDEAKAQLDAYSAQYELTKMQLDYATVKAPKSGTILMSKGAEGSIATSSDYLVVIADLDKLKIKLNVPERYYDLINDNRDSIKATVTRSDYTIEASVDTIASFISPESKTFEVVLNLIGDVSAFKPGMLVKVKLVYKTYEDALVIDQKTRNIDGSAYYYDSENQVARYVDLEVIAKDNNKIVIDEKYSDTLFIVDGQAMVLDGQKVNVI